MYNFFCNLYLGCQLGISGDCGSYICALTDDRPVAVYGDNEISQVACESDIMRLFGVLNSLSGDERKLPTTRITVLPLTRCPLRHLSTIHLDLFIVSCIHTVRKPRVAARCVRVNIQSGKYIIKQKYLRIRIHGSSKRDPRLHFINRTPSSYDVPQTF